MPYIDTICSLESFRRFLVRACHMPKEYMHTRNMFPERTARPGIVYVEAEDKATLGSAGEIEIVEAGGVAGIVFNSKSGSTALKWKRGSPGRIRGEVSERTVAMLIRCGVTPTVGHFTAE